MLRNTNFTHRSAAVVDAVARAVHAAHAQGLRVVLDCEPHADPVARDMGSLFPDAIGFRVVRAEAAVADGRFVAHVPAPRTTGSARADFAGVDSVFLMGGRTTTRLRDLRFEHRVVVEPYQNGFSTRDHSYTEGRLGKADNSRSSFRHSQRQREREAGILPPLLRPKAHRFFSRKVPAIITINCSSVIETSPWTASAGMNRRPAAIGTNISAAMRI